MRTDGSGGLALSTTFSDTQLQQVIASIQEGKLPDQLLASVQAMDPTLFEGLPGDWPDFFKAIKFMNPDPEGRAGNIAYLQQELEILGALP
ncbi:MAG: hypothetical protein DWQ07_17590 [Chloroflexi bacterium]|nr:MAG: hypothetical protein DWQ07_17590 [Chloroflexota bacterium]